MKILSCILLILMSICSIDAQTLPKIKILATGGTIAGKGASANRSAYTSGQVSVKDLIDAVPGLDKVANISGEQIANVGSQDMTVDIWLKLNKRINEIFANNEADGIVITHGTDTQEETAYFLSLTLRSDKPVIITGSMRPSTGISADGPKNIFDAVTVAASKQAQHAGVLLVFNENIFTGRGAVKTSTTHVGAFTDPNSGPVGQVYDGKVMLYERLLRKSNKETPFDIAGLTKLPRVDVVELYADAPNTGVEAAVKAGAEGIVTGGLGNGNLNKTNTEAVSNAINRGVVVVRASRVPTGRVTLLDETDDAKLGTLVSDDLNPQKARVLLMLALAKTKDKAKIQEYFFTY